MSGTAGSGRDDAGNEDIGEEVKGDRARELLATSGACAIDARGPDAAAGGHVPGATIVVDGDVAEAAAGARHERELPVLVFADDDDRAREAAEQLRSEGIEAAAVSGGLDAFAGAGGKLQPGRDEEYDGPKLKQPGG